ncbi:hypothetical protein [Galbibacter sp. BG1]
MRRMILIGLALFISGFIYCQDKEVISQIGNNIEVGFKLIGIVEIDGHVQSNEDSDTPIFYYSDNKSVWYSSRKDSDEKYMIRNCDRKDCRTIHLVPKSGLGGLVMGLNNIYKSNN